ncbi:hypothetical protein CHU98_g4528 [Xylaria longipes]|nr:hypothetical protein CHU98_g4528 [Xylaria longipes]
MNSIWTQQQPTTSAPMLYVVDRDLQTMPLDSAAPCNAKKTALQNSNVVTQAWLALRSTYKCLVTISDIPAEIMGRADAVDAIPVIRTGSCAVTIPCGIPLVYKPFQHLPAASSSNNAIKLVGLLQTDVYLQGTWIRDWHVGMREASWARLNGSHR